MITFICGLLFSFTLGFWLGWHFGWASGLTEGTDLAKGAVWQARAIQKIEEASEKR